jgi:nitroimidazol reductase NimA-like FMN-containing flavoprotein (pyridoxamine 5'-phosphate oxidase superfamily)
MDVARRRGRRHLGVGPRPVLGALFTFEVRSALALGSPSRSAASALGRLRARPPPRYDLPSATYPRPMGEARTERTRLRRFPEQGSHSRADLEAVLDAGFICHLGLVLDGWPMVVPTTYGRDGDRLYVHGSVASRSLRAAKSAPPMCVTVTHVDGVVIARSVFNHSVNYRCAMVYGVPEVIAGDDRLHALEVLTEHIVPGQWDYARRPSEKELAQTTVLALSLDEASVKVSAGPPGDGDGLDGRLAVWAGELPLRPTSSEPRPDPALANGIVLPAHLGAFADRWR